MNKFCFRWLIVALCLVVVPVAAGAQGIQPPTAAQNAPAYTPAQLDQMVAPIALYPDPLVAQILMASTYPLEVVEAQRWLQDPQNASLKGDQLAVALQQQPWDPSVKSLVPFPQVLQLMDKNLQWTEQLGDAFLAQQPAIMDSVQRLRAQAQTAGNLNSTPQQVVSTQGQDIVIEPANPEVVYVPYYNPTLVYGPWLYPDYPPYYFPPPYGYVYDGAFIGFGIGFAIIAPFWGWDVWDWGDHRIDIDNERFSRINHGRPPVASGVWQHDPAHRGGVPYRSAAVRAQFQPAAEQARRSYRGYSTSAVATPLAGSGTTRTASAERETTGRAVRPNAAVPMRENTSAPVAESVSRRAAPAKMEQRSAAPVFESLSYGALARTQAERGASSRSAATFSRSGGGGGQRSGGGNERR